MNVGDKVRLRVGKVNRWATVVTIRHGMALVQRSDNDRYQWIKADDTPPHGAVPATASMRRAARTAYTFGLLNGTFLRLTAATQRMADSLRAFGGAFRRPAAPALRVPFKPSAKRRYGR